MQRLLSGPGAPPIVFESNGHTLNLLHETPTSLRLALHEAGYRCYLLRPGRLVPLEPLEPQLECNVDCLALREPVGALPGWEVTAPLTDAERLDAALASCADASPHVRAHVARALRVGGAALLRVGRLRSALDALRADPDDDVRAAIAWWGADGR